MRPRYRGSRSAPTTINAIRAGLKMKPLEEIELPHYNTYNSTHTPEGIQEYNAGEVRPKRINNNYTVHFTEAELDIALIQLSARVDYLKGLQQEEAKEGNVRRVIELEEGLKPLILAYGKMTDARYSHLTFG